MSKVTISKYSIPAGRLQRASSSKEFHISKFRQVLLRHGMTMGFIAFISLLVPVVLIALISALENLFLNTNRYLIWSMCVSIFFIFYLRFTKRELNYRQLSWIVYLVMISVVEEIGFRLSLPLLFSKIFIVESSLLIGIFLSNFLFAAIHFFTLRWKLKACVFTFLGGIGLSRLFYETGDFALVVLIHLVVTFVNTPSAPKGVNA
tara:strand:- start:656 stop:1270 length:615 start_codon:yes stop_codon:yes gene_type:complete